MADEPPWSIDHRGLAYHYTADIYIYGKEMNPPGQSSTEALYTITLLIYIYIYRKEMNPLVNQSQRPCIPLHYLYIEREREGDEPLVNQSQRPCIPLHYLYIERERERR